jgi:hypothetical protein
MNVVPLKRKGGGEPPREAPHIDRDSLCQLLGVFFKLSSYLEREDDEHKRIELYGLANQLGDVLTGFTRTPKGAA